MVKLLKKKKSGKKVEKAEKKINVGGKPTEKSVGLPKDIELSGSAALAAKINSIMRK